MKLGKYIYYPILFLLFLFIVDKIFMIDYFKNNFLQTGNIVYYHQRKMLLERLKKEYPNLNKKLVLVFGDSRAYPYSDRFLSPEQSNQYTIYNFSAPQAVPAYSYSLLHRLYKESVKPSIILFVVSPEGFDDKKKLMFKPFLHLTKDDSFAIENWSHIPLEDKTEYWIDKFISLRSIDFDTKLFMDRWKNGRLKEYNPEKNTELLILNMYKGEQLAYAQLVNQDSKLKKDSFRMANIYFYNYEIHDTQFYYVEKFAETASRINSKIVFIWPGVYPEYYKEYEKRDIEKLWASRMKAIADKYGMIFLNLNKEYFCDKFYDASHQSVVCFSEILPKIMDLSSKDK